LAAVPRTRTARPEGAFYAFTDVSAHVGGREGFADDIALAKWLLEEVLVATVPGTEFGAPGHLRLSYATDDATIRDGVARVQAALSGLATARG
jgi:aspartate aminotransferase